METIFRYVKTGGMSIPKFKFKVGDMVIYLPWNRSGYRVVKQDIYFGSYCIYQSYPGGGCSDICGVSEEDLELMND